MDIDNKEKILVLSALLHDIGKLVQRASSNFKEKKHEEFGEEFLRSTLNMPENLKEEVINLVLSHHRIPYKGKYPELLEILKEADSESAKHDRDESEGVDEKINTTPLLSVYSYINIGKGKGRKVHYTLASLSTQVKYPEGGFPKNSTKKYRGLKEELEKRLRNLKIQTKDDINTLLYLLLKYTKYVPSAIYVSVPDIPLYDHLKTTAAIALCKYRCKKRKKYLLILGDLSGIQDYIFYNLKGGETQAVDEHGTKRMRGRSLLINLIIDSAVKYIIETLNLYEFNVLWQSGGTFLILAPNEEGVEEKLEKIRKDINLYLVDTFGRLYLNIAWMDVENLENFAEKLDKLHQHMDEVKARKYIDFVRDDDFYTPKSYGKYLCPVCGIHFVDSSDDICDICKNTEKLGEKVGKGRYLLRNLGGEGLFTFEFGDYSISYTIENEGDEDSEVFSIDDYEIPSVGKMRGFKILKTHIPTVDGKVLSISDLISVKENIKERLSRNFASKEPKSKLGILKADVDCLGEIFAKGLRDEKENRRVSISRISTLSFLMDIFFTTEVNNIARENNIYVVFSGGDDLTALGRYDEILKFAKEINKRFKEWVGYNPNLHISASIVFFDEKFPIRRAVEIAENKLEEVKSYYGNIRRCVERGDKISIFSHILSWDEFEEQIELADELWEAQKNGVIPSSLSHVLLTLYRLSPEFYATKPLEKGSVVIPSPYPYLKYYFARRGEANMELLKKLSNEAIFRHIPVGVSIWVMNRKYKEVRENE